MAPQLTSCSPVDTGVMIFDEYGSHKATVDSFSSPKQAGNTDDDFENAVEREIEQMEAGLSSASNKSTPFCNRRKCIYGSIIAAVLGGGVTAALFALSGDKGPKSFFIPLDPPGAKEANRWSIATRDGLTLRVVNALDDFWSPVFDEAVADWERGDPSGKHPDVLTLLVTRESHDPECLPTRGRLRVCNGDYGNTDWQGINTVLLSGDKIVHSIAKMNDHHIRNGSSNRRRYTMCHELGHGFGLPHTDENYYNFDRGDCMDYTVRPGNNLLPGTFNFGVLNELYGPPDPSGQGQPARPTAPQRPSNNKNKDDRLLGEIIEPDEVPPSVQAKYLELSRELEVSECYAVVEDEDGRRKLGVNPNCVKDLGDNYRMEVIQLAVQPDS